MNSHVLRAVLLTVVAIAVAAPSLMAQKYEVEPYAGGFWPSSSVVGTLKSEGLYGVKGGFFLDPNFELELNAAWITHFNPKTIDPKSRGLVWEVAGDYNFSTSEFPFSHKFSPFLVGGVGGITTFLRDVDTFPFNEIITGFATAPNPVTGVVTTVPVTAIRPRAIHDGDTFFAVSYGGGIKSMRLWGPIGLRAEARGRTIPNYYGGSPTWFELTGGFNVMWGER
jgi:hypothetical protein